MKQPDLPTTSPDEHPDKHILELFVMGRLAASDMKQLQSHLEGCEECQVLAMNTGEFIEHLRAASELERSEEKYQIPFHKPSFLASRWSVAFVTVLAVLIAIPFFRSSSDQLQTIEVTSFRGPEISQKTTAPAGESFNLTTNLIGLSPDSCCQIELVDALGNRVFLKPVTRDEDKGTVLSPSLQSGNYWVRVLNNQGNPLREMSLTVK